VRSDCPISNRYAPEIARLAERFTARGMAFRLVYPDPSEPPRRSRATSATSATDAGAARPEHHAVALAGATVTPEAAVFRAGRMVYRGRIDDSWTGFGEGRPEPSSRDLEDVLEAIAAGRDTPPRTTPAVGCFIADLR